MGKNESKNRLILMVALTLSGKVSLTIRCYSCNNINLAYNAKIYLSIIHFKFLKNEYLDFPVNKIN